METRLPHSPAFPTKLSVDDSFERFVQFAGIDPTRSLFERSSFAREVMSPYSGGNVPETSPELIFSSVSMFSFDRATGSVPLFQGTDSVAM